MNTVIELNVTTEPLGVPCPTFLKKLFRRGQRHRRYCQEPRIPAWQERDKEFNGLICILFCINMQAEWLSLSLQGCQMATGCVFKWDIQFLHTKDSHPKEPLLLPLFWGDPLILPKPESLESAFSVAGHLSTFTPCKDSWPATLRCGRLKRGPCRQSL